MITRKPGMDGYRWIVRQIAVLLSGDIGERLCQQGDWPGSWILRTWRECVTFHESYHSIAKFLLDEKRPKAITVFDGGAGGCCGGFTNVAEARALHAKTPSDREQIDENIRVLAVCGFGNPEERTKKAMTRLLSKPVYKHLARDLTGMALHYEGFLSDEQATEIIAKSLRRPAAPTA